MSATAVIREVKGQIVVDLPIDQRSLFRSVPTYVSCPSCHAEDAIKVRVFRNATSITTFAETRECAECGHKLRARDRDRVEAIATTQIMAAFERSIDGR
jgi:Zn ribbon nucleic-acid-binding protein